MIEPPTYAEAQRYDGAAIQHDRGGVLVQCSLQPRDVAVVRDVWRYRFLTAPQVIELWWPGRSARAGQRRLRKLFEAQSSNASGRSLATDPFPGHTTSPRLAIACCNSTG